MYGANDNEGKTLKDAELLSPMYGANYHESKQAKINYLLSPMYGANCFVFAVF